MLMKLTAGVNFINIFTYEFFVRTLFRQVFLSYVLALAKDSYEKRMRLTLMKLTAGLPSEEDDDEMQSMTRRLQLAKPITKNPSK